MKRVILVAPLMMKDKLTVITTDWAHQLIPMFASNGLACEAIVGKDATRERVAAALQVDRGNRGLFVFLDHGCHDALIGSDGRPVIDTSNVDLLANKLVYAIACHAARTLGSLALKKGARGFLGFEQECRINTGSTKVYGHCLLSGLKAMVTEGCNLDQARERIVRETDLQIARLKGSPAFQAAGFLLHLNALNNNRDNVVSLGGPDFSLS